MTQSRNTAIQWLRALAALEVLVWHSDLLSKKISPASIHLSSYSQIGGIGVEVFFTVSGFLMGLITQSGTKPLGFFSGRLRRILPLYWLFTSLVVLAFVVHTSWHLGNFELDSGTLLRAYLILPQLGYPVLMVGWTLEFEIIFYVLVGLFVAVASARGDRARLGFGIGLAILGLMGTALPDDPTIDPWISHVLTRYMFSFAFGWLLACLPRVGRRGQITACVAFAALFAIALAIGTPFDRHLLFRIALGAALVVVALALRSPLAGLGRAGLVVTLVGEASYSIYLSHWFVMSILGKLIGLTSLPPAADLPVRLSGLSLAVLLGTALFLWIERPLDRGLRRVGVGRSPREPSSPLLPGQLVQPD